MNIKVRSIEVDAETADLLEARATARGMSVAELLADITCNDEALPADLAEMRAKGRDLGRPKPWKKMPSVSLNSSARVLVSPGKK